MPTVPTYDSFQVAPAGGNTTLVRAPQMPDIAGKQAQGLGNAMQQAGGGLSKIALDAQHEANQTLVSEGMNTFMAGVTEAQVAAMSLKGKNALDRPDGKSLADEVDNQMDKAQQSITAGLKNDAQREAFALQAAQIRQQLRGKVMAHAVEQQGVYQRETLASQADTAVNRGTLLWGDKEAYGQSVGAITAAVDKLADLEGWDKATRDDKLRSAMSPLHAGVMKNMIAGGFAGQARAYYDEHSAEMTDQTRAAMLPVIKQAGDAEAGAAAVDRVWQSAGPKGENDAVRLFDMEATLRESLKNNPDALKVAVSDLRSRAQAFNAQQAEVKANGINAVWKLLDGGTSLREVMRSSEWLGLPGDEQHRIRQALESEAATRASRAAANEQRGYYADMRRDKALVWQNAGDYLTATDPEVLRRMTRAQVEAKRSVFGFEATQNLLNRWDTLQKPGAISEAKMDADDFNQVADSLGLKPFARSNSEDEKRALGVLRYRVETLVDQTQRQAGRTMTRQEKRDLMRTEMARTVAVPGWFGRSTQTPVIKLTPEDAATVVVPQTDRAQIVDALKQAYAKHPGDPRFEPTEANVRALYLRRVSPAGALINAE